MVRFSVVVPVYNTEAYLRECLDSMLVQTETNWECICINDGSTDESDSICDEYARKDARFKVVHQKNKGLTATRNAGLRMAQGEYVGFLDCDDARTSDWLTCVRGVAKATNADMIRTQYVPWYGGAIADLMKSEKYEFEVLCGEYNVLQWVWSVLSQEAYVWLYFVKRNLLDGFQFLERRIYREDIVSSMHLLNRIKTIAQVNYAPCLYRIRQGSMMHSIIKLEDLLGYWDEYSKILLNQKTVLTSVAVWQLARAEFSRAFWGSVRGWLSAPWEVRKGEWRQVLNVIYTYQQQGILDEAVLRVDWRSVFWLFIHLRLIYPLMWYTHCSLWLVPIRQKILGR